MELDLFNLHGIPVPADKLDTKARLQQTNIVLDSCKHSKLPKIIGGDFNLLPQTESVVKFEESGFRNLIKDFNIKTTRNLNHWNPDRDSAHGYFGRQDFADYVFVSPEVTVKNFEVPNVEISDHLPMILDFEV